MRARIAALWVYPVKSMAGIALKRAPLLATGIEGDRQWMVVDAQSRALTQRQCPALARITPSLNGEELCLQAVGHEPCPVTLTDESVAAKLFGEPVRGIVATEEVNHWLRKCLGQSVRLLRFDPFHPRHCNPARFGEAATLFPDAAPFLVANTASLQALDRNRDPRRFRANIWLEGLPAFEEHRISSCVAGAVRLSLIDGCKRCAVVLVDPDIGERTERGSWLQELAALNAMPGQPKAPAFGINATLTAGAGSYLEVGAALTFEPRNQTTPA